jgi:hypothetical protein
MDVTTFKDGTDSSIRQELWIGQRIPERRLGTTKLKPELADFAVHKQRRHLVLIRDKTSIQKMQSLATAFIVSKAGP